MNNLFQEYQSKSARDMVLTYHGEITYDMVKSMLEMLMNKLDNLPDIPKVKKKVVNVMVEMLENLVKHVSNIKDRGVLKNEVIVSVASTSTQYEISTGNYVTENEKQYLSSWIDKINSFSSEDLRKFYKESLSKSEISEKGGAGLGFIDIARKSKQKLEYQFDKAGGGQFFFTLQVNITKA